MTAQHDTFGDDSIRIDFMKRPFGTHLNITSWKNTILALMDKILYGKKKR